MGYETSPLLRKSAIVVLVVAAAATLLDLFFAQLWHREPLGLLGFGLFCIFYSTLLSYLSRQSEATQPPSISKSNPDHCSTASPVILLEESPPRIPQSESIQQSTHALTVDLEDYFHTEVASQGVSFAEWEQQPSQLQRLLHEHRFAPVREVHRTLLAGQDVLSHEIAFQPSEPAVQVAG